MKAYPTPRERVLAKHPNATCSQLGRSLFQIKDGAKLLASGSSAMKAWWIAAGKPDVPQRQYEATAQKLAARGTGL
jgi:hypothetical protein